VLLRTLFIAALFAVVAETIVHGAHALAQITLRRQASAVLQREFESATTEVQRRLAAEIEAGGDPQQLDLVAPTLDPTCVLATETGCAMKGSAVVSFASSSAPQQSACANGACTIYVQDNDAVDEGRVSATISASATAPNGAVLASRSASVVFRTFRVAPFAALTGSLDASLLRLAGSGAGDDGGAAPNGTAPGSLIDVVYENRATKKTVPANVWRSQIQNSGAVPEPWSP
jgi:hypothetical protein